jgi:hypothetical protein
MAPANPGKCKGALEKNLLAEVLLVSAPLRATSSFGDNGTYLGKTSMARQ